MTDAAAQQGTLFICHECDALQRVPAIQPGNVASCACCGSTLFRNPPGGIEIPLALFISALILFLIANAYPIMKLDIAGIERATTLTGSALVFIDEGNPGLALIVWLSSVFIPGFIIVGLIYVLLSIRYALDWPFTKPVLRWVSRMLPWGMMDVFLLGILVSLVKLSALADIVLGTGFYAFAVLIVLYAAASSWLEPHQLWEQLDRQQRRKTGARHG